MSLLNKLLGILLILFSFNAYSMSLNENGCALAGAIAAHATQERDKKVPLGETEKQVQLMYPRETDPGKAWEYFDYLIHKYSKHGKMNQQQAFDYEFKRCLSLGGEIARLKGQSS